MNDSFYMNSSKNININKKAFCNHKSIEELNHSNNENYY